MTETRLLRNQIIRCGIVALLFLISFLGLLLSGTGVITKDNALELNPTSAQILFVLGLIIFFFPLLLWGLWVFGLVKIKPWAYYYGLSISGLSALFTFGTALLMSVRLFIIETTIKLNFLLGWFLVLTFTVFLGYIFYHQLKLKEILLKEHYSNERKYKNMLFWTILKILLTLNIILFLFAVFGYIFYAFTSNSSYWVFFHSRIAYPSFFWLVIILDYLGTIVSVKAILLRKKWGVYSLYGMWFLGVIHAPFAFKIIKLIFLIWLIRGVWKELK